MPSWTQRIRLLDMHWQLFFLIIIVLVLMSTISLTVLYLLFRKLNSEQKQIRELQFILKDLVHLVAAKDLSAYATLQQIPTQELISELNSPKNQMQESTQQTDPKELFDQQVFNEFGIEFPN